MLYLDWNYLKQEALQFTGNVLKKVFSYNLFFLCYGVCHTCTNILGIITTHDLFCEASFLTIGLLQFIAGDFQVSFISGSYNYNFFSQPPESNITPCALCKKKHRSINFLKWKIILVLQRSHKAYNLPINRTKK